MKNIFTTYIVVLILYESHLIMTLFIYINLLLMRDLNLSVYCINVHCFSAVPSCDHSVEGPLLAGLANLRLLKLIALSLITI